MIQYASSAGWVPLSSAANSEACLISSTDAWAMSWESFVLGLGTRGEGDGVG